MSRLRIQSWDPGFGAETALELEESEPPGKIVDPEVELPLNSWRPLEVPPFPHEAVAFVDGVRRIDARAFVESPGEPPTPALLVSLAAGTCLCDRIARVKRVETRRLLLSYAPLDSLETPGGSYRFQRVPEAGLLGLTHGLRQALRDLEEEVAWDFAERCLTIADGPLPRAPGARLNSLAGYIKSHHIRYLTGAAEVTLSRLGERERTPLFLIESPRPRFSCYLRLPNPETRSIWDSLCRIEVFADSNLEEGRNLIERIAALLPAFASRPYREPRAPQNLFPIAGLEQQLRRRLGDAPLILRGLLQV